MSFTVSEGFEANIVVTFHLLVCNRCKTLRLERPEFIFPATPLECTLAHKAKWYRGVVTCKGKMVSLGRVELRSTGVADAGSDQ